VLLLIRLCIHPRRFRLYQRRGELHLGDAGADRRAHFPHLARAQAVGDTVAIA
jgi:hypothetical protein